MCNFIFKVLIILACICNDIHDCTFMYHNVIGQLYLQYNSSAWICPFLCCMWAFQWLFHLCLCMKCKFYKRERACIIICNWLSTLYMLAKTKATDQCILHTKTIIKSTLPPPTLVCALSLFIRQYIGTCMIIKTSRQAGRNMNAHMYIPCTRRSKTCLRIHTWYFWELMRACELFHHHLWIHPPLLHARLRFHTQKPAYLECKK